MDYFTRETDISIGVLQSRVGERLEKKCMNLEEYMGGVHHQTYKAFMGDGSVLLVRVLSVRAKMYGVGVTPPTKLPSEVATIKYVKRYTKIPVPDVLLYDKDEDGAVGGEWMVMEYIKGIPLVEMWEHLSHSQRKEAARSIASVWSELLSLSFPSIGSIYEEDVFGFTIGPMTFAPSYGTGDTEPPDLSKCGPFETPKDWLLALAGEDMRFLPRPERSSIELQRRDVVIEDIQDSDIWDDPEHLRLSRVTLNHIDLTLDNVLVSKTDPTCIVAVLDWEAARTVPLWAVRDDFFPRCVHVMTEEERRELSAFIREIIRERSPDWYDATSNRGQAHQILLERAERSFWDPDSPLL